MKISVITVCFNAERSIGHTIGSFLEQRHPDKELIIVDGASRDGTVALIESFASPEIALTSEPDAGLYDAMTKGLARFGGEAVGFLNADDRYSDISVLGEIAQALEEADIVSGHLDFVADHHSSRVVRQWRCGPYPKSGFRSGWMPAHPTFYVRRNVVDAVGQFDLKYRIAADYDYMLRAYELFDFRKRHLDRVLVNMAAGGASTEGLAAYAKSNLESLKSRRRWLGSGAVDYALFAKPLGKLSQFAIP